MGKRLNCLIDLVMHPRKRGNVCLVSARLVRWHFKENPKAVQVENYNI